jgi:hypothetical protein
MIVICFDFPGEVSLQGIICSFAVSRGLPQRVQAYIGMMLLRSVITASFLHPVNLIVRFNPLGLFKELYLHCIAYTEDRMIN